jgi:hypothetical protein
MNYPDAFAINCFTSKYLPQKYPEILSYSTKHVLDILKNCPITEEFITQYLIRVLTPECWDYISKSKINLSDDFISRHSNKLNFHELVKWRQLDLCLLSKTQPCIACRYQKLSPEFIDANADSPIIDWFTICEYQELPEWLIRKHADKVYWGQISANQDLSPAFIQEFKSTLNMHKLEMNPKANKMLLSIKNVY